MQDSKKTLMVVGALLAVLLITTASLYISATWQTMPETTQEEREPSSKLLGELIQGTIMGTEIRATAEEVNQYLAYLGEQPGHETMKEMVLRIGEDNLLDVWMPVTYKWIHGTAHCRIDVQYKGETICLHVTEAQMGKLPLPTSFVLSMAKEKLPENVTVDGETLILQTPRLSLEEQGLDVSLGVTNVRIENGEFVLETDGVTDALKQLMQGFVNQLFGGNS